MYIKHLCANREINTAWDVILSVTSKISKHNFTRAPSNTAFGRMKLLTCYDIHKVRLGLGFPPYPSDLEICTPRVSLCLIRRLW
ncbi:UNVERIFIED_CONTAM: hypothetical protein NCL1_05879 [Trichonephila clavipes]